MQFKRTELVKFLNDYLKIAQISDVCPNGLQVVGNEKVSKVLLAVSANLEVFKYAQKIGAELVLVHHGLFWNEEGLTATGVLAERLRFLLKHNINLVAYHLPLDMHPISGNNILTCKKLGLKNIKPFGEYHGQQIGFYGKSKAKSLQELKKQLEKIFGTSAHLIVGNSKKFRTIGVVSGGGMFALEEAAQTVDVFVRGEVHEPTPAFCSETGLNYIGLGHYHSEKLGVQALGELLQKKFKGLNCEFWGEENQF